MSCLQFPLKKKVEAAIVATGWVSGINDDASRNINLTVYGARDLSFCEDTDYIYGGYIKTSPGGYGAGADMVLFKIAKIDGTISEAVYSGAIAASNLTGSCGRLAIYGDWIYSYWIVGVIGIGLSFGSPFILRHNKADLSFDTTFKGATDKGALVANAEPLYSMIYHCGLAQRGDYAYGYDVGCRFLKYNMATGALTYQRDMRGTILAYSIAQMLVDSAGAYLYAVGSDSNDTEILKANEADGTYVAASRLTMTGKTAVVATSIIEKPDGNLIVAGRATAAGPVYKGFVAEITANLAAVALCKENAAGAPASVVYSLGTVGFCLYGYNGADNIYTVYDWSWNVLKRFKSSLPIPRAMQHDPATDTLRWLTAGLVLGKAGTPLLIYAHIDKFMSLTGKIETPDTTVYLESVSVAEFLTDVVGPGFTTGIGSAASTALSESVASIKTFGDLATMVDYATAEIK